MWYHREGYVPELAMWSGTVLNNGRRAFLSGQEPFAKAARQAGLDLGPSDTQQEILKEAWHMFIAGWQKLSLVDYPDKVACTLFTGGCNLRCPYCHNSELLDAQIPALHIPDILEYLRKRQGILDGVVVSGGEPCMQPDLADFLGELKQLGYLTKLDTNGCYPAVLQELLDKKLVDYVAMDIKNSPQGYAAASGVEQVPLDLIWQSLRLLFSHKTAFELRTTTVAQLHTKERFQELQKAFLPLVEAYGRKIPAYYLQAFQDRDTVPFAGLSAPTKEELEAYAQLLRPVADKVALRGI